MGIERGIVVVYLSFFALDKLAAFVLNELNMRHLRAWRRARPQEDAGAVAYSLARGRFSRVAQVWSAAFRLWQVFVLLPPLLAAARAFAGRLPGVPYAEGLLFSLGYGLSRWAGGLPLDLYDTFVVEERFGFNRTTWRLYALDLLKGWALFLAVGLPLMACLFLLIDRGGPRWWLWAFGLSCVLDLVMVYAVPAFIEPLFNRFEALPEGDLRRRVLALSDQTGFHAKAVLVKDASRRSGHSNAYFTGFGGAKRIVFYDTLVSELTVEQNVGVLAHELGHWKLGHVLEHKAVDLAARFLDLYMFNLALGFGPLCTAFGLTPGLPAAFVTYGVVAAQVFFWRWPLLNVLSRRQERDADRFAARAVGGGRTLVEALDRVSAQNLHGPATHPWYHAYYSSHPNGAERAAALGASLDVVRWAGPQTEA